MGRCDVVAAVVFGEEVAAEVAFEVAPDRVDVIAVALRAVVLDQERRPLHAVVVLRALFGGAEPGEADRVEAGFADRVHPRLADRGGLAEGVLLDQPRQQLLLARAQLRPDDAGGVERGDIELVHREDVARRFVADHRFRRLRRVERRHERARADPLRPRARAAPSADRRALPPDSRRRTADCWRSPSRR